MRSFYETLIEFFLLFCLAFYSLQLCNLFRTHLPSERLSNNPEIWHAAIILPLWQVNCWGNYRFYQHIYMDMEIERIMFSLKRLFRSTVILTPYPQLLRPTLLNTFDSSRLKPQSLYWVHEDIIIKGYFPLPNFMNKRRR